MFVQSKWKVFCPLLSRFLATTSADLSIRIWNTETFKMEKEFTGHKGWVWDCVFSSDSEFLVSGILFLKYLASSDESIKIWDIKNNILSLTLRGHTKVKTFSFLGCYLSCFD